MLISTQRLWDSSAFRIVAAAKEDKAQLAFRDGVSGRSSSTRSWVTPGMIRLCSPRSRRTKPQAVFRVRNRLRPMAMVLPPAASLFCYWMGVAEAGQPFAIRRVESRVAASARSMVITLKPACSTLAPAIPSDGSPLALPSNDGRKTLESLQVAVRRLSLPSFR